jgi:hypothetical protein
MTIRQGNRYGISVDDADTKCLTLRGQEYWDDFASDPKSIAEIIINAANYGAPPGGAHFSYFDRVLWVEPHHPNPNLSK